MKSILWRGTPASPSLGFAPWFAIRAVWRSEKVTWNGEQKGTTPIDGRMRVYENGHGYFVVGEKVRAIRGSTKA